MNFGYSVPGLLNGRKVTTSIWDRRSCVRLSADEREKIREIIDTFGWNSAQAQGLSRPVTDYNRLKSSDHHLYLICKPHWVRGTRVIGGLKCGRKHLYFRKDDGYEECEPMCVLDFYIHERYQRKGIGRRLFKSFMEGENEQPSTIAYDRPSPKLINFLKKYYGCSQLITTRFAQQSSSLQCSSPGMSRSVQQNNNFAVFNTFFDKTALFRVKAFDKRSGILTKTSSNSSSRRLTKTSITLSRESTVRESLTPPKAAIVSTKDSKKSTTSASSSIITRYNCLQKSSRTSSISVDSCGKPKPPFTHRMARPPLIPITRRVATIHPAQSAAPSRLPMGPYPGWQPLDHGPRSEKRKKKESAGLTRLSPIQSFTHQEPATPACRCIPPWATGLSADRATGIVKKIVTVSAISAQKQMAVHNSSKIAYNLYKGRSIEASGARDCLHWAQSRT